LTRNFFSSRQNNGGSSISWLLHIIRFFLLHSLLSFKIFDLFNLNNYIQYLLIQILIIFHFDEEFLSPSIADAKIEAVSPSPDQLLTTARKFAQFLLTPIAQLFLPPLPLPTSLRVMEGI
jgi:hypothetical protein